MRQSCFTSTTEANKIGATPPFTDENPGYVVKIPSRDVKTPGRDVKTPGCVVKIPGCVVKIPGDGERDESKLDITIICHKSFQIPTFIQSI